ncbi:MAG: hypothetical protein KIT34_09000 [Cyanobacteria bacterium TGS_CYA1]|nr:hypothetical protein [Cyanobacteria bacterium TGS_CYA1]MDX2105225.1 hypothetical protein [Candidatus Melainabacteria bacterium]
MASNEENEPIEGEPVESSSSCKSSTGGENMAGAFVNAFGHALVQTPFDITREVVNGLAGKKVVPKVELVKCPEKQEDVTSAEWQAQKVGSAAGMIGAGMIVGKIITKILIRR